MKMPRVQREAFPPYWLMRNEGGGKETHTHLGTPSATLCPENNSPGGEAVLSYSNIFCHCVFFPLSAALLLFDKQPATNLSHKAALKMDFLHLEKNISFCSSTECLQEEQVCMKPLETAIVSSCCWSDLLAEPCVREHTVLGKGNCWSHGTAFFSMGGEWEIGDHAPFSEKKHTACSVRRAPTPLVGGEQPKRTASGTLDRKKKEDFLLPLMHKPFPHLPPAYSFCATHPDKRN